MIWGYGLQFISVSLLKCLCIQILILNSKEWQFILRSNLNDPVQKTYFFKLLQILHSILEEVSGICVVI